MEYSASLRRPLRNPIFQTPYPNTYTTYPNICQTFISNIWAMHYIPNISVCQLCFDTKHVTNIEDFLSNFVINLNKLFENKKYQTKCLKTICLIYRCLYYRDLLLSKGSIGTPWENPYTCPRASPRAWPASRSS